MLTALIRTMVAVTVAVFAARQLVYGGRDLARYNKIREMSDDTPILLPIKLSEATNAQARTRNPFVMMMSIPGDIARYFKLKSM